MERSIRGLNLEQISSRLIEEGINPEYITEVTITYDMAENPYEGLDIIKGARGCGNTTRLIDYYIQELFAKQGEWINIKGHYGHKQEDKQLFHSVLGRLQQEHSRVVFNSDIGCGYCRIKLNK